VQPVPEFVKQRARVIEGEQARLPGRRLGEVHHVDDDRQRLAVEPLLLAKAAHPGAAALGWPREVVADEQRDRTSVRVLDLPGAGVGMVEGDVGAWRERHAEELRGREEGRVDHPIELEIWFDLTLVEIELGLAALLGKVAPVPRFDHVVDAVARGQRLQVSFLASRTGLGGLPDGSQQVARGLGCLRHGIGEAVGGEIVEAEQGGLLGA
jgi:hypothetical protein